MSKPITRAKAEATLAAIKAQYAKQITPTDWSGHDFESLPWQEAKAHLIAEHGYDEEMLDRKISRTGKGVHEIHAAEHEPQAVYPVLPVLVEDYTDSGHWAIAWEEGPDEWVFTIQGGSGEEDRVLMAQAAEEFGADVATAVKSVERPVAKIPAGVYVEPVNHVALGLYPA